MALNGRKVWKHLSVEYTNIGIPLKTLNVNTVESFFKVDGKTDRRPIAFSSFHKFSFTDSPLKETSRDECDGRCRCRGQGQSHDRLSNRQIESGRPINRTERTLAESSVSARSYY